MLLDRPRLSVDAVIFTGMLELVLSRIGEGSLLGIGT
jgi:hypothetical protein